ncbi:MAG: TonB-dependent receptor [Tunicatimonas sp.]
MKSSLPPCQPRSGRRRTLFLIASIVFFFGASQSALRAQSVLDQKTTVTIQEESFSDALAKLEQTARIKFLYPSSVRQSFDKLTVVAKNEPLASVLDRLFSSAGVNYEVDGNQVILTRSGAQKKNESDNPLLRTVRGTVTDGVDNIPLPSVNVVVEGTTQGTITDLDGQFTLQVPSSEAVLVFSFIGYLEEEVTVGDQTNFDVVLMPDVQQLSEIVVVGYGTMKKEDVIGSVSSIEVDQMPTKSVTNFDAAIQGMAAGVSVQSASGEPGAPSSIIIRGANSINSSTDPLWIIDGMPVYSNPRGFGGSNQNPMSLINPNDIASIQVLKDAAATSIYGSRGSNGVIIVTTKSGKAGVSQTNFSLSSGISQVTRTPQDVGYADAQEWFAIMDAAYSNSLGRPFTIQQYEQFAPTSKIGLERDDLLTREEAKLFNVNTNWFDEAFQIGSFQDFNISSSKGFDEGSFYVSGNYRTEQGVLKHNQFDRFSLRSNLNFTPIKNASVGIKLNFSHTDNDRREGNMTPLIKYSLPWMPVRDPYNPQQYFVPYTEANLVARNDPQNFANNIKSYRGLANAYLEYRIPAISGLSLRTEFSTDIIQTNALEWRSKEITLFGQNEPTAQAKEEAFTFTSINYNAYASYDRAWGKHALNTVVGAEAQRTRQLEKRLEGVGLAGRFQELGVPQQPIVLEGRLNRERYLLGYFGRANYKFNDRYLLGLSARRDGSSAFAAENRWGNFLAVSAGWIVSEEPFMNFLGDGTFLKLRGSYGETGNQNVRNNLQAVNFYEKAIYGDRAFGVSGTLPSNIPVSNLTWETTRSTDVGIDYGFWRNRINGSVAYYHRFIDGLLMEIQLPSSAGVGPNNDQAGDFEFAAEVPGDQLNRVWSNIGNMINSGLELEVYSVNVNGKNFRWTTNLNIAFNRNIVESIDPALDQLGRGIETRYTLSRKGQKRNVWYIADYAGVNPDNGVPYVYVVDTAVFNRTGETVRLQTAGLEDSTVMATIKNIQDNRFIQDSKNSDPTYFGGITNQLTYKNFDLSFLFSFSGGNYLFDYDRQTTVYPNETRPILKEVLNNSWKEPGDVAEYPRLVRRFTHEVDGRKVSGFGDEAAYHNKYLYRADFVRLRNVTVGYTLPDAWLSRVKLQSARLYGTANNLWVHTRYPGFDPEGVLNPSTGAHIYEWNTPIPQLRTFIIGLDIKL